MRFSDDNENAESSQEELSEDIEISNTDENSRSKRLGVFGNLFGGGGDSGSEGGSGNFLFDIIRVSIPPDGWEFTATVVQLWSKLDEDKPEGF